VAAALLLLPSCASAPPWHRPFEVDRPAENLFDHDVPRQWVAGNGRQLAFWGEELDFLEGHSGYDFTAPEGTPVLAVTDAKVVFAGEREPGYCPILKRDVTDVIVVLEVYVRVGTILRVEYVHLSGVAVAAGDQVKRGQVIGRSGKNGCAVGPHLHLEVKRQNDDGQWVPVDPFGFEGGQDPWAATPGGAASERLWEPGQAPALFHEVSDAAPNPLGSHLPVGITRLRWQGIDDRRNPNNEVVEVTLDPRYAPPAFSMKGITIRNDAGDVFRFPADFTLTRDRPTVRIFSGPGTATDRALYWGHPHGVWSNRPATDCAVLTYPNGVTYTMHYGRAACEARQK